MTNRLARNQSTMDVPSQTTVSVAFEVRCPASAVRVTPAVRPVDGAVEIPILGLWPETTYEIRLVAFGASGTAPGEPLRVTTGSLPSDLPRFQAGGPEPSPGPLDPEDVVSLLELDPLGNVTRRLGCARGLAPRFHDALVEPAGSYWLMFDENRVMNLVQHIDPAGGLVFEWSAFDHLAITDLDLDSRSEPISFRSLSEITSIDTRTGDQFAFRYVLVR